MKKVGKYLLIALLLLIALCLVGVLYLFFIPGSNLFGITYISYNTTITTENSYLYTDVNKVILKSNAYNVQVSLTDNDKIFATVYSNSLGFTHINNSVPSINASFATNTLEIKVNEPSGLTLKNDSLITLYLPKAYNSALEFENNAATTTLDKEDLKISGLTYTTNSGNLNLNSGTFLGSLKVNINNATCTIAENVVLDEAKNDVTLTIANGKFDAPTKDFGQFNISSNVRGVVIINSCNNLVQKNNTTAGGRIEIAHLNS